MIALAIALLFSVGYGVSVLLGLPFNLGFPTWLRVLGVPILVAALGFMGWAFVLRGPGNLIASTYITLMKFATRKPLETRAGREEPLVVAGPYRYVRSPLYFGAVVLVLGLGFLTAYSFIFVTSAVVFLWFRLVLTPFEEKELRVLFGAQWESYAKSVPMMIPFTKMGGRSKQKQ